MTSHSADTTAVVVISGNVQGVGFRQYIQKHARAMNLAGWVRNREDGCVELAAGGRQDNLDGFIETVRSGPPGSQVNEIDIEWTTPGDLPEPFEIRR